MEQDLPDLRLLDEPDAKPNRRPQDARPDDEQKPQLVALARVQAEAGIRHY